MKLKPPTPKFKERVEGVLAAAYRGLHHVPSSNKGIEFNGDYVAVVRVHGSISTTDNDILTRLVFAAHDQCVRVEISPCNPHFFKIVLHPRVRGDSYTECHPRLSEAIDKYRKNHPQENERNPY